MTFGMQTIATPGFPDIVKFDANAGRMFRIDYDPDTRSKVQVDITTPPPRFALDFGSFEVGYGRFTTTGPEYRTVPLGQPLPQPPVERDEQGRLLFRQVFRAKLYGKILDGLREWASTAQIVLQSLEDTYHKFRDAPEAQSGKIPIVELTRTMPVTLGKGARQRTLYSPCFVIVGWTERPAVLGERTVPAPSAGPASPDPNAFPL